VSILLFRQTVSYNRKSVAYFKIKTVHILSKKSLAMLRRVNDDLRLKALGVHIIPCDVEECIYDREVDPFTQDVRNTPRIYFRISWTNSW
jgi:hypothetical protein